jgi:protein arginine kinase activator
MNLCEECGLRSANVHVTQIVDNEAQSFHLCEACARERGISISIDEAAMEAAPPSPAPAEPDRECPSCRMKLSEFRSRGRLGCPGCYKEFEREIEDLLLQSHGSTEHKGKMYGRGSGDGPGVTDVSHLRTELETAIRNEEFERAATLRDAIHSLLNAESAEAR